MNKRKNQILITVGILLVAAIIFTPTVLLLTRISTETTQAEQQELQLAFVERYGTEAKLIEMVKPESLYVYVWELGEVRYFTLAIDGLFVELGSTEIQE